MPRDLMPRFTEALLLEALTDSPVVLVHGPHQCGKSTLAKAVGLARGHTYVTFDDDTVREAAASDPRGFVDDLPDRTILDEVQRVPNLFTSLKRNVDEDRRPGKFILTGSMHVLLLPKLADSLAGRMEVIRLHPFAQCELLGRPPTFLADIFAANFQLERTERSGDELLRLVTAGGYPPALERPEGHRRDNWYRDYTQAIV